MSEGLRRVNYQDSQGPELKDIDYKDVHTLLSWAQEVQMTPGLVHGARRKAAGLELIRMGVEVLRGRVDVPQNVSDKLRTITV